MSFTDICHPRWRRRAALGSFCGKLVMETGPSEGGGGPDGALLRDPEGRGVYPCFKRGLEADENRMSH